MANKIDGMELRRRYWQINDDQITLPKVTATELREAMKLVYDNFQPGCTNEELVNALGVLSTAAENGNWVIYVP